MKRILGIFKRYSDNKDFIREFKRTKAKKRTRRDWIKYQQRTENRQAIEAEKEFKEKRHDRRKKIKEETKESDDKKKQQYFRDW